ncbi:uncharacterized protein LOC143276881 [Babylonia areolata]|uniref:uncharacterized protein LOC143276881 n=1 Tax=Babylonia areolata TaxID=304850 RepID=UPI003FD2B208
MDQFKTAGTSAEPPKTKPDPESEESASGSGGTAIVTPHPPPHTNQNAPSAAAPKSSPKVQFGAPAPPPAPAAAMDDKRGSPRETKKGQRALKDLILKEVLGPGSNQEGGCRSWHGTVSSAATATKKGILKFRREASLTRSKSSEDSEKQSLCFVNQAYVGDDDDDTLRGDDVTGRRPLPPPTLEPPPSTVAATKGSAFPFDRRKSSNAEQGGGFAGLVELLFQRSNLDSKKRDVHPFGRDAASMEAAQDEDELHYAPMAQRQSLSSAFSKLVLWATLLSFLVGAALGIVFLSEMYNAKHREDYLLKSSVTETPNTTS